MGIHLPGIGISREIQRTSNYVRVFVPPIFAPRRQAVRVRMSPPSAMALPSSDYDAVFNSWCQRIWHRDNRCSAGCALGTPNYPLCSINRLSLISSIGQWETLYAGALDLPIGVVAFSYVLLSDFLSNANQTFDAHMVDRFARRTK